MTCSGACFRYGAQPCRHPVYKWINPDFASGNLAAQQDAGHPPQGRARYGFKKHREIHLSRGTRIRVIFDEGNLTAFFRPNQHNAAL
jgi:hypothetical protein